MSAIYLILAGGVLDGPITLTVVPGIGVQMPDNAIELPAELSVADMGYAWALVEGDPQQLPDHRGIIYSTEDGSQLLQEVLGPLPDGATKTPKPGLYYTWGGDGWVLDEAAQLEAVHATERAWRNVQIAATDFLVMPDYPISAEQRAELYAYRQSLRDWPVAGQFPDADHRPQPPAWIAEHAQ
ncbi:phage tail assembly chaperone [Pseudomonas arcuscaelestis]|uniref:phage tail assembly chaperone n=1 Tax=Pseudomonas arcuscaelestis TaxID=2710591 RepID=UPI00193CE356|nr:phage tail assembly chaperone [Pseudomonas arcuscaelestis]MBM3113259.1 phage tail assembly chaperone [Pseudomonas arcuscaelestis]